MTQPVKLGVMAHGALLTSNPELGSEYCRVLESAGAESVWVLEHVAVADDYEPAFPYTSAGGEQGRMATAAAADRPDPLELLSWLAGQSASLLLGTAVMLAPLQSPVLLAKRAATVDALSGGRLLLGVGVGWQREEYEALGVPFGERGSRLDETIPAMRALWGAGPGTFHGRHFTFDRIWCRPQPKGPLPVIVGGNSAAAVRRAARLGDGWFPFAIPPEEVLRLTAVLDEAAGGRSIEITAWPGTADPVAQHDPAYVRRFVEAGATRIVYLPVLDPGRPLESLAERVAEFKAGVLDPIG